MHKNKEMKIGAVISEFNPFHNGHKYCIDELRKRGATHVICIMSGNFVQRGEASCISSYARAESAVRSGADLVVELPVVYSLSSAENFCMGAVAIAEYSGVVDMLGFGTECEESEFQSAYENIFSTQKNAPDLIKDYTEQGLSYPMALEKAVLEYKKVDMSEFLKDGNNVLALNYIISLEKLKSDIKPVFIKRNGSSHNSQIDNSEGRVSASYIRNLISQNNFDDLKKYMPESSYKIFMREKSEGRLFSRGIEQALLYKLQMSDISDFENINEIGKQGLAERMYKEKNTGSLERYLQRVKTKRYPMARIKRHILCLALGIDWQTAHIMPQYARILAFNQKGTEILRNIKGNSKIPFSTSLAKLRENGSEAGILAEKDAKAYSLFNLGLEKQTDENMAYCHKIKMI